MPKIVDYPRASLKNALELAGAVYGLGGSCSEELAADRLGKKPGGAFSALVSAAGKFGLIDKKQGQLSVTQLFRDYKLAYSQDEERHLLRLAMLKVPVFGQLVNRFAGRKLPVDILEKVLAKEFGVDVAMASRVSGYFQEGAQLAGLLDDDGVVENLHAEAAEATEGDARKNSREEDFADAVPGSPSPISAPIGERVEGAGYSVRVTGPGLDSVVRIESSDDLLIVDALLRRVRRSIEEPRDSKATVSREEIT